MPLTFADKKLLNQLSESYVLSPNETLFECFDRFGRQEFEDQLRIILPHHLADVAMKIAIRRCLVKQREQESIHQSFHTYHVEHICPQQEVA